MKHRVFGDLDRGAPLIGLAAIARMAFNSQSLAPLTQSLVERLARTPADASALLDLSTIQLISGQRENGLDLQSKALSQRRLYTRPPVEARPDALRVLALAAPGDFMANTPIEFLLENSDASLETLYILPGEPIGPVPDHDVAFVAVAESEANRPILARIAQSARAWPRPLLNAPGRIAALTRDGAWATLCGAPGLHMPLNLRIDRARLVAYTRRDLRGQAPCGGYPIIARPLGSHAGDGLTLIADAAALATFLDAQISAEFFVAPFIDYRSPDGLYRKYRIALIDGKPLPVHMAVSPRWMIHYLNGDMLANATNRADEARFMATFDEDFASRHAVALSAIAERTGLDYLLIDCGQMRDGLLLVFELGAAMIVHSMDPIDIFPYKQPAMQRVFTAFNAMLERAAGR
jgi:hypothetical protein